MSWLAPALVGDLGELEERLAPGAGLEGIVVPAATGGEDLRCLIATPQTAAGLLAQPRAAEDSAGRPPAQDGADPPPAQEGRPAPTRGGLAPAPPPRRDVNLAQLTLDDAVAAMAGGGGPGDGDPSGGGAAADASPTPRLVALAPPAAIELETASYSSLKELERCGYRYYLERVLGLEERGVEEPARERRGRALDALSRGSLVHRVLELHDFGGGEGPRVQDVEQAARGLGLRPAADELSAIAQHDRRRPCASSRRRRIAAAAEVWREQPFAYPAGEQLPLLTGVIDVLAREHDGGYLVIDYKSDAVAAEDDLEALVARDYALQRELYALAVLRGGAARRGGPALVPGAPAGVGLGAFRGRPRWARCRSRSRSACGRRCATGFAVSPRPHRGLCASCPGRSRMCSWPDSATMAEEPAETAAGG